MAGPTVTDWASRVTTYGYDLVGRMTSMLRPNGTKQTKAYDDAGELTQLTELAPDGVTVIYSGTHGYDAAGQLTGETIVPSLSSLPSTVTQTFDADNRLLTHNGAATTFDADGNLLSIASGVAPANYTYDARNRLTSAGGLSYAYDAENHRVALTNGTGTTHYAINPNAALDQVLVRTAADGTKTFYVYGLGLLHEETGSTIRYYHQDRRGDTVALTDNAGAVTDRASYGAYGELLSRTGTTITPFLYSGQWGVQTDASGIYYHRARYYHPGLRRFLNQDTLLGDIAKPTGLNRFAYANNNPINNIDPLGLDEYDANWGGDIPGPSDWDSNGNLRPTELEVEGLAVVNGFANAQIIAIKVELNLLSGGLGGAGVIEGVQGIMEAETVAPLLLGGTKAVTGTFTVAESGANLTGVNYPESLSTANLVVSSPLDILSKDWPSVLFDVQGWIDKYMAMKREKKNECP